MSKSILVTGGAGFLGSYLAKALIARGEQGVVFDNFTSFLYPAAEKHARWQTLFPDNQPKPVVIKADICDGSALEDVFRAHTISTVIHLAAHASVGQSMREAKAYTETNVVGTVNVLEEAARHNVGKFIFASSSSVYAEDNPPFHEVTTRIHPVSPYGASKAAAETYCQMYHELHGLPVTILRFFSVYGPWGRPDMAPAIFAQAICRGKELAITHGRARDYVYIDDAIAALLAALDHNFDFEIFNVGSGEPTKLAVLAEQLGKAAGITPRLTWREPPPGEMAVTWADIEKITAKLRWQPRIPLAEGALRLMAQHSHAYTPS